MPMDRETANSELFMAPEECLATFCVFLRDKYREHFNQTLCLADAAGAAVKNDALLLVWPVEISEPVVTGPAKKILLQSPAGNNGSAVHAAYPPWQVQVTLMLSFESEQWSSGVSMLLRVQQLLHEYRSIKAGDGVLTFAVVSDIPLGEQIRIWRYTGRRFQPSVFCRLNLCLESIRRWEIKLAQERIVRTKMKKSAGACPGQDRQPGPHAAGDNICQGG